MNKIEGELSMKSLTKKSASRAVLKLCLGLSLLITFSYASYGHGREGLSKSRQAELIKSLQDYQPLYSGAASSQAALTTSDASALQRRNEYCDTEQYSRDQYCLERRYMNDGYYRVKIAFSRDLQIPIQPEAPFIIDSKPLRKDTAAREAFLKEWTERISIEYLGSDYQLFHSVGVSSSNRRSVIINLEISEASELVDILNDPRIIFVRHIGSPKRQFEEITN